MIFSEKAVTIKHNMQHFLGAFFNDNLDIDAIAHLSKLPCLLISTSTSGKLTSTPGLESGTVLEWPLGLGALGALPGLPFFTFSLSTFNNQRCATVWPCGKCISSLFRLSHEHSCRCAWVVSSSQLTCAITAHKAFKLHPDEFYITVKCHLSPPFAATREIKAFANFSLLQ